MFSISQTSRGFFCIEWVSTEKGPLITNSEHLKLDLDFKNKNHLNHIIDLYKSKAKIESNTLSVILNTKNLLLSSIEAVSSSDKSQDIINWHESNILGKEFCVNHYNYYFPVNTKDSYNYLCVYLPKDIKNNIIQSSKELGYDLRYLSIDIFSSALGARQVFFNEIEDEYLVWKICNNNTHRLVLYNGSNLKAYIEITKNNNIYISNLYVGPRDLRELLLNCVNEILINKSNFHRFKNIYIYQTKQNKTNINQLINLNFKNIKVLNFNKMIDITKDYNPLKFVSYVENGIAFKGLDL